MTHKEFDDHPEILHIELGALCGNFGQQYYAECFITEYRAEADLRALCAGGYHATVFECDAKHIPCGDNRFSKIIACNPYGYGFNDQEDGALLLKEFHRVLQPQGKMILIGSKHNGYCTPKKLKRSLKRFLDDYSHPGFQLTRHESPLPAGMSRYPFKASDGTPTRPDFLIELTCIK
jgi:hypothetical protein